MLTFLRRRKVNAATSAAARVGGDDDDAEPTYKPIDWALVRRMMRTLHPYRWRYVWGMALGLLMIALEMQSPRFMQKIINYVTNYTTADAAARPAEHEALVTIVTIVGLWALVVGSAIALQRYVILVFTGAGERVQFSLRRQIFAHLQKLSMSYYDRTKLGRIISRCTSDITSLREVNVWGLYQVITNFAMTAVAGVMLVLTDWRLFLAVAWLGPVLLLCNYIYRRRAGAMWQHVREGFTRVSTNFAENITGMRVVTAFNRQEANLDTFNRLQETNTFNNLRAARINGTYLPLLSLIAFIGRVIILSFGGYLVVTGRIGKEKGVGAVVAAYLYWDWFMNPILNFGVFYNLIMQAMAGGERVFQLLDTDPEVQDVPGAKPLPRIVGRVQFENVTFGYRPERPVLHDVSFEAQPGQMVALVGATGSGKSSIISLIARFYQPQQGRVLVDGEDIRHVTGRSLNEQTGLVLQVNYLFSGTVMQNIRYARPQATDAEVIHAAQAIGSHDAILSLKAGYQADVGERGANLSLGQRQLICFTRAFLADPRIFMLDEATSAVDTATEQIVQRSLERLLEGRTTFVVAHRLSTIMRADQILVIDKGKIVERGTHRELVDAGGRYAHLYEQFVLHSE